VDFWSKGPRYQKQMTCALGTVSVGAPPLGPEAIALIAAHSRGLMGEMAAGTRSALRAGRARGERPVALDTVRRAVAGEPVADVLAS